MIAGHIEALDIAIGAVRHWQEPMELRVAGRAIRVRVDGEAAAGVVEPAFGHLRAVRGGDDLGALEVRVAVGQVPTDHGAHPRPDTARVYRLPGGGVCVHHPGSLLEVYRPDRGVDLRLSESAALDPEVLSHPLAASIAAWGLRHGVLALHAGAVEVEGRAVLLVGPNGAGKSTTALACAAAGMGFLADDLCLLDPAAGRVYGWYGTVKLLPDSAAAMDAAAWPRLATNRLGKAVVHLDSVAGMRLVDDVSLAAIAVLDRSPRASCVPAELTAVEMVPALRWTAVPGPDAIAPWLHGIAAVARSVPAIRLPLAWDLARVVEGVRDAAGGRP